MALENSSSSLYSELSVADVLNCISSSKVLMLFQAVALSDKDCSRILITKLKLTRKQYYSNIEKLMHVGLVKRISGKHSLTSLGKIVFSILGKIESAIRYYWKLKAIDSIIMSVNTKLPAEEYQRFVDNLIDNDEIKAVLLSSNNNNKFDSPQSLLSRTTI